MFSILQRYNQPTGLKNKMAVFLRNLWPEANVFLLPRYNQPKYYIYENYGFPKVREQKKGKIQKKMTTPGVTEIQTCTKRQGLAATNRPLGHIEFLDVCSTKRFISMFFWERPKSFRTAACGWECVPTWWLATGPSMRPGYQSIKAW